MVSSPVVAATFLAVRTQQSQRGQWNNGITKRITSMKHATGGFAGDLRSFMTSSRKSTGCRRRPRMLDAGCGTGQMLKHLQQHGDAVGLDLSPEAIAFAASRDAKNLVLGSVTKPPFSPGSFDIALALDVIEHVDDDRTILKGLLELIKPGGALILTVPAYESLWSDHDKINHHRRRYRTEQLQSCVESAGFDVERITYCNTILFPVVYVTRRAQSLKRRFFPKPDAEISSDLHSYPGLLNSALYRVMLFENRLLRRWNMPAGVSILAVARRPLVPAVETIPLPQPSTVQTPIGVA